MALKENYKDDILDVSVNTKRKYRMTENADGTISLEDETVYTQEGDSFGATDMNATNGKVNTLDANLDGFKFYPTGTGIVGLISDDSAYTDEDGNYVVWGTVTAEQLVEDNPNTYKSVPSEEDTRGKVGADTAIPFKSQSILIGTYSGNKSIDVSAYLKSNNTVDNFIIEVTGWSSATGSGNNKPPTSGSSSGYYASLSATSITKSLSGNTLTISDATATAQVKSDWGTGWAVSSKINYKLYHI